MDYTLQKTEKKCGFGVIVDLFLIRDILDKFFIQMLNLITHKNNFLNSLFTCNTWCWPLHVTVRDGISGYSKTSSCFTLLSLNSLVLPLITKRRKESSEIKSSHFELFPHHLGERRTFIFPQKV